MIYGEVQEVQSENVSKHVWVSGQLARAGNFGTSEKAKNLKD